MGAEDGVVVQLAMSMSSVSHPHIPIAFSRTFCRGCSIWTVYQTSVPVSALGTSCACSDVTKLLSDRLFRSVPKPASDPRSPSRPLRPRVSTWLYPRPELYSSLPPHPMSSPVLSPSIPHRVLFSELAGATMRGPDQVLNICLFPPGAAMPRIRLSTVSSLARPLGSAPSTI